MINELLVNLVDSVLGKGKRTARGNKAYHCPFCNHSKLKLEINFDSSSPHYCQYACWVCQTKGKNLAKIFKKLNASQDKFIELKKLVGSVKKSKTKKVVTSLKLPEEFKPLHKGKVPIKYIKYLKSRNITLSDIKKYNMGYCNEGIYSNMIIIPSYDSKGNLNYFTARSIEKNTFRKYKNPDASRDIIPFEFFINWNIPLIICEGPFDAIAIKRNAIPLLGKSISSSLMKKIVTSKVEKIYIALDTDARKQALKIAEYLINQGKEVYITDLQEKDPGELGFTNFTKLIQKTLPLSQYELMERKLQMI